MTKGELYKMGMSADFDALQTFLEGYIDKAHPTNTPPLSDILNALSEVCISKAQHYIETWQDKAGAKVWDDATDALQRAMMNPKIERAGRY